jgi:hypothetical protein
MITRKSLLEELQKLRQSRERPFALKSTKTKQSKKDKLLEEAAALLDSVEEEN